MDTSHSHMDEKDAESQRRWELRAIKDNHTRAAIAIRARDARRRMGITQKELSKKMRDANYSTWSAVKISNFEHGEYDLKLNEAWMLSLLFGCEVTDFLPPIKLTPGLHPKQPAGVGTREELEARIPSLDSSQGFNAVRVHDDDMLPPETVEAISGEKVEPVCCSGECCGPGSYCCANAGPHEHDPDLLDRLKASFPSPAERLPPSAT